MMTVLDFRAGFKIVSDCNTKMSRRGHFAGVFAQSCAARFVDRGDEIKIR